MNPVKEVRGLISCGLNSITISLSQSDFGSYAEETDAIINANSTSIEQIYTNIQTILTDIANLEHSQIEANAYINSGLLFYDEQGVPVYGLEVGQSNVIDGVEVFNKYAQFTASKLAFYDSNDNEVAYVSDKKLYITHVEVTESFQEGGFIDIVMDTKDIVLVKLLADLLVARPVAALGGLLDLLVVLLAVPVVAVDTTMGR